MNLFISQLNYVKNELQKATEPKDIVALSDMYNRILLQKEEDFDWTVTKNAVLGHAVKITNYYQKLENLIFFCNNGYFPDE